MVAGHRGVSLDSILARAGLARDALSQTGLVAARSQVCSLLNELSRRSGEATIGFDLAAAADPTKLGLTGRALFGGRTLRECLVLHARHMPTLQGGVSMGLDVRDGRAHWRHAMANSDAAHAGVLNEGIAAFVLAALRAIAGADGVDAQITLPHRPRASSRLYEEKLGAGVSFGNGVGISVSFDAAWLDRPNPHLGGSRLAEEPGEAIVDSQDWNQDDTLTMALERIFSSAALAGTLSLLDASRSLGIAPRSLQRRLLASGTSFEALVDTWRRSLARTQLADPALPVGSISRSLGYSDPAHFVRAFRRWEGITPLAYRRIVVARNGN
ncbi:AraC family transcriptional regulator ligand-binding domain-containing protein [Kaistia defluvii]|uniref:helix-turn-helix transcriptional regulator n=1 Tax=Kaistia defluvii TaxID=410841 RepID=UPI00224D5B45|nr:AraC family transcriptional regulator [Kaistia defluvii]MCX5519858.1 AraC family transcriptional regulator ligand-binding domain-containing protein [Kaistia defluvii]